MARWQKVIGPPSNQVMPNTLGAPINGLIITDSYDQGPIILLACIIVFAGATIPAEFFLYFSLDTTAPIQLEEPRGQLVLDPPTIAGGGGDFRAYSHTLITTVPPGRHTFRLCAGQNPATPTLTILAQGAYISALQIPQWAASSLIPSQP